LRAISVSPRNGILSFKLDAALEAVELNVAREARREDDERP
jgi:hypothetical protein